MITLMTLTAKPLKNGYLSGIQVVKRLQDSRASTEWVKPGVGQYIATHATLTARDFFPAKFYPPGPFTCIFSKTSPDFFLC